MVEPSLSKKALKAAATEKFYYLVVLAHLYFEYVRPATILPFLSPLKLGGVLQFASLLIWLSYCSKEGLKDKQVKVYLLGLLQMVIWVPFAVNNFHAFNNTFNLIFYLFAAILPLLALVNSDERAKHLFHHWIIINFIVAIFTIRAGGKGTGGFLADENDVGLAMNMVLPYALYFSFDTVISKKRRWFYRVVCLVVFFSIVYSRSRGALVGFAAVLFTMWLLSPRKIRNLGVFLGVVLLFGGLILSVLPAGYYDRMLTATDPNNSTRVERIYSWKIGWAMFTKNPIFGVGPGNFPYRVVYYQDLVERPKGRPPIPGRVAHSFYFTLLPELGLMGVAIFCMLTTTLVSRMRAIYKSNSAIEPKSGKLNFYGLMAKANIVSLAAYLSAGAFITVNYYPCYWFLIGFGLILHYRFNALSSQPLRQGMGKSIEGGSRFKLRSMPRK